MMRAPSPRALHFGTLCALVRFVLFKTMVAGFVDFDYSWDLDRKRSTSGFIFTLCAGAISWKASLQLIAALSTIAVEYIAATEGAKEAIWLKGLLI